MEDHINTGFILVKPTLPIRTLALIWLLGRLGPETYYKCSAAQGFLIADFLDENWQSEQGGVRRFIKFLAELWCFEGVRRDGMVDT